jgi:hypothetical protein
MRKTTIASLAVFALAAAPLSVFAADDAEAFAAACEEAAEEKGVSAEEMDAFMAKCVAAKLEEQAEEESDDE